MGKKKSLSLFYPSKGRAQETSSPVAGTTAWLAGGSYKQTAPNFHLCVKHNAVVFYNKLHPVGVSDMGSWKAAPRTGGWKNKLARQECIGCWTPLPHPGELSASKCLGNVRIKRWEQGSYSPPFSSFFLLVIVGFKLLAVLFYRAQRNVFLCSCAPASGFWG